LCAEARKEFGHQAELTLEVRRDPEFDDPHLTLVISLPAYDNTLRPRIEKLREIIFERVPENSDGTLLVMSDFRLVNGQHGV
jgi:hypothetical protein